MKFTLTFLFIVALLAVAVALFAWAVAKFQNASPRNWAARQWRKRHLLPLLFRQPESFGGTQFCNIGEGTFEHGHKSYIPDAATASRYLLYKIGSDADHCAVCGAGDTPLGSSDDLAEANNLDVPITVKLFGAVHGTVRVTTDGTVANGNRVKAGANGQVTVAANGDVSFGIAIIDTDTSSAAGDVIAIIPQIAQKYAF